MKLVQICNDGKNAKKGDSEVKNYDVYVINGFEEESSEASFKKLPFKIKRRDLQYSTIVSHFKSVYIIGGCNSDLNPIKDVLVFNPDSNDGVVRRSYLNSAKSMPVSISTNSHLYVFSKVLNYNGGGLRFSSGIQELPNCEILSQDETGNFSWSVFDIPSNLPPPLTLATCSSSSEFIYEIYAYTSSIDGGGVYISIKNLCSYHVCFQSQQLVWTESPNELPFSGEAKPTGSDDKCYVARSRYQQIQSPFGRLLSIYKLVEDTEDANIFYFDRLTYIHHTSFPRHPYTLERLWFHPVSSNNLCRITSCVADDSTPDDQQFIVVQLLSLSWGNDVGSTSGIKQALMTKNQSTVVTLLWDKKYPKMPMFELSCFVE